jgi:hypothetical protein
MVLLDPSARSSLLQIQVQTEPGRRLETLVVEEAQHLQILPAHLGLQFRDSQTEKIGTQISTPFIA